MKTLVLCVLAICAAASVEATMGPFERVSGGLWNTLSDAGPGPVTMEILGWNRTNCMGPNGQSRADVLAGLCTTGTLCTSNPILVTAPLVTADNVAIPAPSYIYATCLSASNGQQRADSVTLYATTACSNTLTFNDGSNTDTVLDTWCTQTTGAHFANLGSFMITATSGASREATVSALTVLGALITYLSSR